MKYPVIEKDFILKMLGACINDEQRALIFILWASGMHISSAIKLEPKNLVTEGEKYYLEWIRPKTNKTLRIEIEKDYITLVRSFLEIRKRSRIHYFLLIRHIGRRAGYDAISPMTFRHTRCVRALMKIEEGGEGYGLFEVPHLMGTTPDVVARNYSQIPREELEKRKREVDAEIKKVLANGKESDSAQV